ncbi:hypothetical protein PspLS_04839 [Pyricularia sp. CBS 133598]|nr:hypothetical protein PspLS_04839 [Pyricularia sp. CBS 133598]
MNRFVTEVTTQFNPFASSARAARLFLAYLPPNARASGMNIKTSLLPKTSTQPPKLQVKFKDGTEMNLDCQKLGIKGVLEEVNRHVRQLEKADSLSS